LVGLLGVGLGFRQLESSAREEPPAAGQMSKQAAKPKVGAKPVAAEKPADPVIAGRVLDPDGKPVSGAVLALGRWGLGDMRTVTDLGKTDGAGRFQCRLPPRPGPNDYRVLVARASGFAADWVAVPRPQKAGPEVELRLGRATVPVRGRVLTLEGK